MRRRERYTKAMHQDDVVFNGLLLMSAVGLIAGVLGLLGVI